MNILFLLSLALIAVFTLFGIKVGLIRRVLEFAGLVISFIVATNLAPRWYLGLAEQSGLEEMVALYLTWFVIFLLGLVLTRVVTWGISKTLRISVIGWLDRVGGAFLGFLIGLVLASVVLIGLSQLPGGEVIRDEFNDRTIPRFVYRAAPTLMDLFRKFGGDEQEAWDKFLEEIKKRTDLAVNRNSAPTSAPATSPVVVVMAVQPDTLG